jgi:dihydrofolate synthase/folylpolyglutamate synthase
MSYSETTHYLYNLQKQGIKFGLNNIVRLMSAFENPHSSFPSIHIAGTNGKGSTSAIIASVLMALGLKVGLFTSPHLVSFTERIRVNHEEITEYEVVHLAEEIRGKISHLQSFDSGFTPTFFEVVTAMALLYFKREKIDIAVIEVGMGGRLDATNIIIPEVSVITSIGYDHREFLGSTLKDIAHEKAGIIKEGIPIVVSSHASEVLEVIEAKAKEMNTVVYLYGRDFSSVLRRENTSGIYFDFLGNDSLIIQDLYLTLTGEHQMQNASVAIKAVTIALNKKYEKQRNGETGKGENNKMTESPGLRISGSPRQKEDFISSIRKGLLATKWPGRLEMIKYEPPILIDGAHNAAAAVALSHTLIKTFLGKYERIILVLGIMGDKDIEGIMKPLLPLASEIILTSPNYERAASPERLAHVAVSLGFPDVNIAPTVKDALELAKNICQQSNLPLISSNPPSPPFTKGGRGGINNSPLIVVTGSFYTIGEAKECIGYTGVLSRLRE